MSGNVLGLKVESNGITVLEPFDTCLKFSNASGKTNIHFAVSDIVMNFSFSILKLFLAVEEDILAFLRMSSKKVLVICSQFDKVASVNGIPESLLLVSCFAMLVSSKQNFFVCEHQCFHHNFFLPGYNHTYTFWRPQAPSGYAVLGDCLTPRSVYCSFILS